MLCMALYRRLAEPPGNFCFSPYSISQALALVHPGTRGAARTELEQALGNPDPLSALGALARELAGRSKPSPREKALLESDRELPEGVFGCHLSLASALWHQKGYPVRPEYLDALRNGDGAEVRAVDFAGDPPSAVRSVNDWAAQATRHKIENVLDENELSPATRVLLANAVYFRARWSDDFSPSATEPAPFQLEGGQQVMVPTMNALHAVATAQAGNVRLLLLPYTGESLAMVILLPEPGKFGTVERELEASELDRLIQKSAVHQTEVALPKFRVESSLRLKSALEKAGLATLFSSRADFSGVSSEPGFFLSEVIHKTYIDVDERGTEAAAVTMPVLCGSAARAKKLEFRVNRPFLYGIYDLPTRTMLFMGRVVDPRSSSVR